MSSQGTVHAASGFDPEKAAEGLRKAMKGLGTDEARLIKVITSHSNKQRQVIEKQYKTMYGRDLRSDLKSEISGRFEDVVLGLLDEPRLFDANQIHDAIKGAGTNEAALIEILCSRSNQEKEEIKQLYESLFGNSLEDDIRSDTSGHFQRMLISQLVANRAENAPVDPALAREEAQKLYDAGEGKLGTDESAFNSILSTRSILQLCETFKIYSSLAGRDIEDSIRREMSGNLENGFLAIVKFAKNPHAYFAECLYKSMKGAGSKDKDLIRTLISRSEIDMVQIKQEFERLYGKTLASFIKGDTSGDYKKTLLALIGEQ